MPLSPSVFEIFGSKYIWVTTLTFWGYVRSLGKWPFYTPYSISYGCSIVTNSLSPVVFEILGPKHIGVTTLTFQGHVTSSSTWRFDSPYGVSNWCSVRTKSLSPSVFEIFGSKYIWGTTLTLWGHVISSWACDHLIPHIAFPMGAPLKPSPYLWAFSWYSAPKCLSNANGHCACAISRDLYPYGKFGYIFEFLAPTLPIHYDTFIGLRRRIRGACS